MLISAIAFVAAALFRLDQLTGAPARSWYEGRAAAESIKTLSWLYAVGGDPFELGRPEASSEFRTKTKSMLTDLRSLLHIQTDRAATSPTPSMEELRAEPLAARRDAYRYGRLEDQQRWYSNKSMWNSGRAKLWGRLVLLFEVAGATAGFLAAFDLIEFNLGALAGAGGATAAAWLETKQHQNLASAYRVASHELESILALVDDQDSEERWSRFVADAEQAVSREHTLWRARATARH
jgi:hypothetical protein